MKKLKLLILTDHLNHSSENSLYILGRAMCAKPDCESADVATRGLAVNHDFFLAKKDAPLFVSPVDEDFAFSEDGRTFSTNLREASLSDYDAVWIRMPPPLSRDFLGSLDQRFPGQVIVNNPKSIWEMGSKRFLLNFPELCPAMQVCDSVESIIAFKNRFPIVLKPFREYGGKGIVRIDGEKVWEGKTETSFDAFIDSIRGQPFEYLGVEFLRDVGKGDKRIIVVLGKIMGASLRLPAENSWICNVAMGGSAHPATPDADEVQIVNTINPVLEEMGIVMYGVDTLVGNDGRRILSEINATSIGGLPQIAEQMGLPLVEEATDLIWQYIHEQRQMG